MSHIAPHILPPILASLSVKAQCGSNGVAVGNDCLVVNTNKRTWQQAQDVCKSTDKSQLVVITDTSVQTAVHQQLQVRYVLTDSKIATEIYSKSAAPLP